MKFRRKKGQAIVEMAILFPFFLLLVVGGIIDFGFAFYNFLTLQQLANDAAIYAAEGNGKIGIGSSSDVQTYINARTPSWWANPPQLTSYQEVLISGGLAKVKKVYLQFTSPMYTPFYQTMFQATTSTPGLTLKVMAAYQVPNIVAVR